jgi:hypothetical protein
MTFRQEVDTVYELIVLLPTEWTRVPEPRKLTPEAQRALDEELADYLAQLAMGGFWK